MSAPARRLKILWLVSWYPNRHDPFDGDFIQRHARAAAIHHDIHVLFIKASDTEEVLVHRSTGLTEELHYFREPKGALGRVVRHWIWRSGAERAIKSYIEKAGRPDLVHVHVGWKAGLLARWVKRTWGVPYLLSEHWSIFIPGTAGELKRKPFPVRLAIRRIFAEARAVVAVSRFLGDAIEGALGRNVKHVLPNVVDTTLFRPGNEKYERFTFVHVSNMDGVKNVDTLLKDFALLVGTEPRVDAQLILIGNRDDRYPERAREMGLLNRKVFFRGEIPYRAVAEELRRCHCLLLYSETETFSCVTAEALCAGVPVWARRVGALPELVEVGGGMLLDPKATEEERVAALRQMVERGTGYDAEAVSRDASARYGYGAVADAFDRLYRQYGSRMEGS